MLMVGTSVVGRLLDPQFGPSKFMPVCFGTRGTGTAPEKPRGFFFPAPQANRNARTSVRIVSCDQPIVGLRLLA